MEEKSWFWEIGLHPLHAVRQKRPGVPARVWAHLRPYEQVAPGTDLWQLDWILLFFTWWTGREGQTDCPGDNFKYEEIVFISLLTVFKGSGTSKHIGWLDAQGGQGQGGEPQAEVREHCAGPVHREPHAGQPGFPGCQSKVKEVIQFSFHENYLKKELDLFCRKHRPQNLGSVIKCTAKAVRGAVGGDQKWTFLKNFRCVVIPRWETPRHSLGVSPVLLPSK